MNRGNSQRREGGRGLRWLAWLGLLALLAGCSREGTQLARIRAAGAITVATRNSATTYYEGPHGFTGLEYDMARLFARHLGVELNFVVPDSLGEILDLVSEGEVDFAAAGLTVTPERRKRFRFGPSYQKITPQLVYRIGTPTPKDLDHLDGVLEIVKDSSHEELLRKLKGEYPNLSWTSDAELSSEELLALVWQQVIDYTVADSNEVAIDQRYYPELRVAFDLSAPQSLAWAFRRGKDDSLYREAVRFFKQIRVDGTLAQLIERYYGHIQGFDYVGTKRYLHHIRSRLPRLIPLFMEAAEQTGIDWRLLAAIGYQESHWNPRARSPTGVRGIMMLTQSTMRHLGLKNRLDPRQSIIGGARYIAMMKRRIPDRIPEPDRTWMALAAYNVGFGHLEDARILAQRDGANPDKWVDVKKYLPRLSRRKWYRRTKHGYARGGEPVRYVENIRSYYDILVWYTERDNAPTPKELNLPELAPIL